MTSNAYLEHVSMISARIGRCIYADTIVLEGNVPLYPRGQIDGISPLCSHMKFLHEGLGTNVDIRLRADNIGH
jgi:hypothetical protein